MCIFAFAREKGLDSIEISVIASMQHLQNQVKDNRFRLAYLRSGLAKASSTFNLVT